MKTSLFRFLAALLVVSFSLGENAWAFISKQKVVISEVSGTITESVSMSTAIVTQGGGAAAGITFGTGTAAARDSDESIEVTYDSNAALTRLIIYTDNKNNTGSVADSTIDATKGVDSGGLVGQVDAGQVTPLLWAVTDTNTNYTFDSAKINGTGVNASTSVSDKDHSMTFTVALPAGDIPAGFGGTLAQFQTAVDNVNFTGFPAGTKPANADTDGDGLYPQLFGNVNVTSDLTATITDPTDNSTHAITSQELSKNFAVIGFNLLGTTIQVVDKFDSDGDSNVTEVVQFASPIYLPAGADFRLRPAQDYKTNTLTVEIVQQ